jgi:hypothetical protein
MGGAVLALMGHLLRIQQCRTLGALLFGWGFAFAPVTQWATDRWPGSRGILDGIGLIGTRSFAVGSYYLLR